uniref:Uncharacterized protein n=1 Tax=Pyxicephalus adspersus TaxID=30357 RepID=A0AAV3A1S7_PYXAD|nr:TPA: hypothetical protein GDO54_012454 [Pyxicephalus adspersus]
MALWELWLLYVMADAVMEYRGCADLLCWIYTIPNTVYIYKYTCIITYTFHSYTAAEYFNNYILAMNCTMYFLLFLFVKFKFWG